MYLFLKESGKYMYIVYLKIRMHGAVLVYNKEIKALHDSVKLSKRQKGQLV